MAKNKYLEAYQRGLDARNNANKKGVVTTQPKQNKKKKKKKTSLQSAQEAFDRGQKARKKQSSNKVVTSDNKQQSPAFTPKVSKSSTSKSSASKPKTSSSFRPVTSPFGQVNVDRIKTETDRYKGYDYKKDLQNAKEKGENKTYLGTDQKKKTVNLASSVGKALETATGIANEEVSYYTSDDWKDSQRKLRKDNKKQWRDYLKEDYGWTDEDVDSWFKTDEGKEYVNKTYKKAEKNLKKEVNKTIGEEVGKYYDKKYTLETVDALKKSDFDKMVTGSRLGKDLGNKYLESVGGKKLLEDIGSKTVEAGLRSKAAYGVMQGMSKADIWSGSVGTYNEAARTGMEKVKDSAAYNVGYGVGMGADMLMGGVASRGASIAEMTGEGVSKAAAKLGAKGVGKSVSKIAGKEAGELARQAAEKGVSKKVAQEAAEEFAKMTKSQGAKKFFANRAGELAAETPTNILDAAKMSLDADGNLDKKAFRYWLIINSGLTFGVGGALEGIGAGAAAKLSNKTIELLGKKRAGTITADELAQLNKNIEKLRKGTDTNAISGGIKKNALEDVRLFNEEVKAARIQRGLDKARARQQGKTHDRPLGAGAPTTPDVKANVSGGAKGKGLPAQTKKAIKNIQGKIKDVDDEIAKLEEKLEKTTTPTGEAQIKAEIGIAEEAKSNLEKQINDYVEPPKPKKAKKGYKEYRTNVETNKLYSASVKGENTKEELRKGLSEIADDIRKGKPKEEIDRKIVALQDKTMKVETSWEQVLPEQELMEAHRAVKKTLREKKINIGNIKGTRKQILEKLGINDPGSRVRLVKSGGESIEKAYKDVLELQARVGAAADGTEVNTLIRTDITNEEDMLRELCRLANEDKNHYRNVIGGNLSDEDIARQYLEQYDMIERSARKIAAAKPEPKTKLEIAQDELEKAQREYKRLDKKGGGVYRELEMAKQDGLDTTKLQEKYNAIQRNKVAKYNEIEQLKEKRNKIKEKENAKKNYAELSVEEMDYYFINGTSADTKAVKEVMEEAADGVDGTPPTKPPKNMNSDGSLEAVTEEKKGLNYAYHKMREAIVDNFDSLEHIANHLPTEMRTKMLTQINELRRSQKTARAIVAEKGRKIYQDAGLTKRGRGAEKKALEQKRIDFERYCFLKHELDRKRAGNNFMDMSRADIEKEMRELEDQYALKDKDGVVLEKNNPIKNFQSDMVAYFDDLLQREVDSGITSAEEAAKFRKTYPNYVPTYREKEFKDILKRNTKDEIDVGRGIKAAKGGSDDPLVPLYNQMQVKTNTVLKRTELNRTLNILCMASGTSKEELERISPFFKEMSDEEKPQALLDTQVFTHSEGGKNKAIMYFEGNKIEINIDKDVYDAIRRWSGEDRKAMTIACLEFIADNKVIGALNTVFKKFITDYSLIFGLKNFKRDTATALFYTTDIKGYIKNFPKAVAICFAPEKYLSDSMKVYKEALQTYKENGGVISQFVSRDSARPTFYDTAHKFNLLKYVEDFNSTLETVPRMAEFISALDAKAVKAAGKNGNYDDAFRNILKSKDDVAEAMYRAKDVTLNFDRSGWFGARLNRGLVPFFNPAIQGLDKLGRKLVRDNIRYGADGKLAVVKADGNFFKDTTVGSFVKMGAALTGMVALPTYAWNELPLISEDGKRYKIQDYINGEVPGYEKQSDYNRYANYLFPIGDGKFIKIPRARELASMQAPIDFVLDNMKYGTGNKWQKLFSDMSFRDWKSVGKISYEQIGPVSPFSDNLIAPIWRTYRNETWYGGKIESGKDLTYREDGERYKIWDEKTSALAKLIGSKYNMSPKKIDNILDSYTGIIYDFGISQTSAKNDVKGRFEMEGWGSGLKTILSSPFSQGFVIDSVFSNANKSDYYNYVDKRNAKLAELEEGSDEYVKVKAEINKDKNAFSYTSSQYDELQSQIYLNDKLTPTQRNQYARQIRKYDNIIWNDRKDGKGVSSRDPMADIWNLKDEKGKRILSTKKIIESCSYTFSNDTNTIRDAYTLYKDNGGKSDNKFMEVTLAARDVNRAAGESMSTPQWEVVAYSNTLNNITNSGKVIASYIENEEKRKHLVGNAELYAQYGFTLKNYKAMRKTVVQGAYDLGYDYPADMRDGELTMVIANARTKKGKKYRDGSYQANDFYIMQRMNAGRCLDDKQNGHYTAKDIKKLCDKYELNPDDNHKWDYDKVLKSIEKDYGDKSDEVKSAMFIVIVGASKESWAANPYGEIGDYSLDNDTGVHCEGYGGYGYGYGRRRRHRRGHGGGGGRGATFKPEVNTAGSGSKITKAKVSDTSKRSNGTKKSNLNDAYRRKLKKLREETRK